MTISSRPGITVTLTNSVDSLPGETTSVDLPLIPPLITGKLYANYDVASEPTYEVWDVPDFTKLANPSSATYPRSNAIAVSPDQSQVASRFYNGIADGKLSIFDATVSPNVEVIAKDAAAKPSALMRYSPDGNILALGEENNDGATLYDVNDNYAQLADLSPIPNGGANGMSYSADGQYFALSVSGNNIHVYDATAIPYVRLFVLNVSAASGVQLLAFSPDGQYLCGTDGASLLFTYDISVEPFNRLGNSVGISGGSENIEFSPDSSYLAICEGSVNIYDTSSIPFQLITTPTLWTTNVRDLSWSRDGNLLALGGTTGTSNITIVDSSAEPFTTLPVLDSPPVGTVTSLEFD